MLFLLLLLLRSFSYAEMSTRELFSPREEKKAVGDFYVADGIGLLFKRWGRQKVFSKNRPLSGLSFVG